MKVLKFDYADISHYSLYCHYIRRSQMNDFEMPYIQYTCMFFIIIIIIFVFSKRSKKKVFFFFFFFFLKALLCFLLSTSDAQDNQLY